MAGDAAGFNRLQHSHADRRTIQLHSSPALGRALVGAQDCPSSSPGTQNHLPVSVTPSAARSPQRASKLDPFKSTIAEWLEQTRTPVPCGCATAWPAWLHRGLSILKDYLHAVRAQTAAKRAYVRMEPGPGNASRSTGGISVPFSTKVTRASSMPSVWSNVTAANCLSSSRTVRVSRPSCAVTSTPSSR